MKRTTFLSGIPKAMIQALLCNQCGAPFQAPLKARFVQCNHCGTNLEIHRETGVTFTETVDRLVDNTDRLADQVAELTRQSKLQNLDREWERTQASFCVETRSGSYLPTEVSSLGSLVKVLLGLALVVLGLRIGQAPLVLFGIVIAMICAWHAMAIQQQAEEYREREIRYLAQRRRILEQ